MNDRLLSTLKNLRLSGLAQSLDVRLSHSSGAAKGEAPEPSEDADEKPTKASKPSRRSAEVAST